MGIYCKASRIGSDVRCRVCGQGFLVYGTGSDAAERALRYGEIVRALREHHAADGSPQAHPPAGFHLAERESDPAGRATARSNEPMWAAA